MKGTGWQDPETLPPVLVGGVQTPMSPWGPELTGRAGGGVDQTAPGAACALPAGYGLAGTQGQRS